MFLNLHIGTIRERSTQCIFSRQTGKSNKPYNMKYFLLSIFLMLAWSMVANDVVVKVNFCAGNVATTNAGWNNFINYNTSGTAVTLSDVDGNDTDMILSLTATFNGTNTEGVQSTTTSLNMTKQESYSAFWSQASGNNAKASSGFTLSGLDTDAEYDFVIFGSRKGQSDNRETLYAFEGANSLSATLNCSSNASNVATVTGAKADANGKISLTVSPGANNNNSVKYYYINAMQITQRGGKAPVVKPAIRILAIGNSFSEDAVEQNLYELANEAGVKLIIGNAYRGGQSLKSHWEDVTSGNNTFEYRKVVNGVRTNTTKQALATILANEPWDYITFQQVSQESGMADTFEPYLGNLIDYAKTNCSNAEVKFGYHITWAYAQNSTHSGFANYNKDQMTMYNAILSAAKTALSNHSELSFIVPSGTAIQNARTSYIGDNLNRDGYHLNYGMGRYTAACTWLEAILGINPMGLEYRPSSVDEITAGICQKAAHSAVITPYSVTNLANEGYEGDNTIVPAEMKINFGDSPTTNTAWNNITSSNTLIAGLKDIDGNDTEIVVMLNDAFNATNTSGATSTTTSLDMPAEVSKSCFWGYNQGNFENKTKQPTGGFAFSHMNKDLAYDFTFFSSRNGSSDNRETAFSLTGLDTRTGYLDGASNSTNTVTVKGVRPNENGIVTLSVSPGENNNNTYKFYYINAVGIKAHAPEDDNYVREISTAGELRDKIAAYPAGDFIITADLDFTDVTFNGINSFSGTLDGQGHTISNLSISNTSASSCGIFQTVTNASISRLNIKNATVSGGDNTGIIAGIMNGGKVEQCSVTDSKVEGGDRIAPIVGRGASGLLVQDCLVLNTEVTASTHQAAGIMAASFDGGVTIKNCCFEGSISSKYGYVAAILGLDDRDGAINISNCLSLAKSISGGHNTRIAHWGNRPSQCNLSNNWSVSTTTTSGSWDSTTDARFGNTPDKDSDIFTLHFFSNTLGWDMEDTWQFIGAGIMPVLRTMEAPAKQTVSIGSNGYATFIAQHETDFSNAAVKAYTAKIDGDYVKLTEVSMVPAKQAVVVKGDEGTYTLDFAQEYATELTDHELIAAHNETQTTGAEYVLGGADDEAGFYRAGENSVIPAGEGYLSVPASDKNVYPFSNTTTGIALPTVENADNAPIYNLRGQRLSRPEHGINIIGHRKVMVK